MPTSEYLSAFLEKAKELLPDWMYKRIYSEAMPASGGKAKYNKLQEKLAKEDEFIIKPQPQEGETRQEFIDRFMGDEEAVEDFPDEEQRLAVAISFWEQEQENNPINKQEFNIGDMVTSDDEHFNEYNPVAEVVDVRQDYVYTIMFEDSNITHEFAGSDLESADEIEQQQPTSSQVHVPTPEWEEEGTIIKRNDEKQLVYGIVLEPEKVDGQNDIISAEEIEKTAHSYLKKSRVVGSNHVEKADANVVESYIAPANFTMKGEPVVEGSWILAVKIEDDTLWQQVKQGGYNAFSVGGYGQRN